MARIDLDAARAARLEKLGDEGHTLVLGGEEFTLPSELPADFAFFWTRGDQRQAISVLLGDSADRLWDQRPSVEDVSELADRVGLLYVGGDAGNSSASPASSKRTSKRSRPTSPASTE